MSEIQKGVYRHYKGGLYHVMYEVVHTETDERLIVYKKLDHCADKDEIYARPKKMFLEQIVHEGRHVLRFEHQE